MKRRDFLQAAAASAGRRPSPNIVFVLADDLGYGDLGVTGNRDVPTPNLDRLAREGIRFTQYYAASPICSPSRAGMLTGQFPARHRINNYLSDRKHNARSGMPDWLDPRAPSVARIFQSAGYATAHFGKWHLGGGRDVGDAPLPQAYGFDEAVTSFEGLGDRILIENDGLSKQSAALGRGRLEWAPKHKLTEIYVDRALDFAARRKDAPFYMHLWPCDVHDDHMPARADEGGGSLYDRRFRAVLREFDRQMGRLVEGLDQMGLVESTLIVFTGDNGPTAWPRYYKEGFAPPGSTGGLRGRKWSLYEGGIRQPLLARWKGRIPAGRVDDKTVFGAVDLLPTFCSLAGVRSGIDSADGEDRSRALLGRPSNRRTRPLFWEYGRDASYLRPGLSEDQSPNLAMRDGRWKFLVNADGTGGELYDLAASEAERENLVGANAAVATRLKRELLQWRNGLPG